MYMHMSVYMNLNTRFPFVLFHSLVKNKTCFFLFHLINPSRYFAVSLSQILFIYPFDVLCQSRYTRQPEPDVHEQWAVMTQSATPSSFPEPRAFIFFALLPLLFLFI